MIPRKEAQRLLEEFMARLEAAEVEIGEPLDVDGMRDLIRRQMADSDLVLRGSENVEQKARRYLTEGRVQVTRIDGGGLLVGTARGSAGEYTLGYDPTRNQWRCTCGPSGRKGRCSHVIALKLITTTRGTA